MEKTCGELIGEKFASVLEDLELYEQFGWDAPEPDDDTEAHPTDIEAIGELGPFHQYYLEMAWREPDTFDDQPDGYYELLLSWGGPSDMFRFYNDGTIEYRFHDWGDGAGRWCNTNSTVRALAQYLQEANLMPEFNGVVIF